MSSKQYLVVTGVPSIKKYVFGTDRLKEIRGASALLEDLTRNTILNHFNSDPKIAVEQVYAGGGAGQFIINAEEEDLNICLQALEGLFFSTTKGGARLNWGKAAYADGNYQRALKSADLDALHKIEDDPILPCSPIHTGFIRECDSCDGLAAGKSKKSPNKEMLLCSNCLTKESQEARQSFANTLTAYLQSKGIKAAAPEDFEEIGEQCQTKNGYTALVYADGNAMGKLIDTIDQKEHYQFFSQMVDKSIKEACLEAIHEACFMEVESKSKLETIPAEILMLGGDDLLVYLSADTAFPFAIKVAEKFSAKTLKAMEASTHGKFFLDKTKNRGLTVSLGVAFAKSHTPFAILLGQAEELLHSAKQAGSDDPATDTHHSPTYIDYHLTAFYNQLRVADSRINHLVIPPRHSQQKPIRLYQKPYSLEKAKALLHWSQELLGSGIARTRLHRLGNAPSLGKMNGTLECLKIYTGKSTSDDQRKIIRAALSDFDCIENMPWHEGAKEDTTVLLDLMEIAGFNRKTENSGGDSETR